MGMAYRRTSGCCLRCSGPFASGQVVVMVRESLIAEVIQNMAICTKEWVAVCSACVTPEEQATATKQDVCRGCSQPLLYPERWTTPNTYRRRMQHHFLPRTIVCSSRCAQRCRRRSKRLHRPSITCAECGTAFQLSRSDSRYCSAACRQKAYRQRASG